MDAKSAEGTKESTTNSAAICKEKHPTVQQKDNEKFKEMNSVSPEKNKDASFIQASKGKRKYNFMSDETSDSEQSGNPSSVLLGSNSRCGGNSEKYASFKGCSDNSKRDFSSETGLVRVHNTTSSTTGVISEQIIGESNVSIMVQAASNDESETSSEGDKRYLFNEDTKDFLGSEEVSKIAGFVSKNIFYHSRSFTKSDISAKNKEMDTISGMDYQDVQISSRVASPVCCRNEETGANTTETLHTRDIATAATAGPSGTRPHMHGRGSKNRFACNLCDKEFEESWQFDAHYRTHKDKKAFECNICQRKFKQKGHLETHYRTHTGEKPYVCDVCQKGFNRRGNLKTHYIIHTGEKPYVCDVCKREFTQKLYLDRHARTHTGEKPFVCDVCNKKFADQSCLKTHYRTHTGEKPFVCEICKKDFPHKSSLWKHARRHTGVKPYKCTICGKAYSDSSSCRRHYKEKHK